MRYRFGQKHCRTSKFVWGARNPTRTFILLIQTYLLRSNCLIITAFSYLSRLLVVSASKGLIIALLSPVYILSERGTTLRVRVRVRVKAKQGIEGRQSCISVLQQFIIPILIRYIDSQPLEVVIIRLRCRLVQAYSNARTLHKFGGATVFLAAAILDYENLKGPVGFLAPERTHRTRDLHVMTARE